MTAFTDGRKICHNVKVFTSIWVFSMKTWICHILHQMQQNITKVNEMLNSCFLRADFEKDFHNFPRIHKLSNFLTALWYADMDSNISRNNMSIFRYAEKGSNVVFDKFVFR